jgi:transcriptional regulator with XRE-family HTH domain
MGFHFVEYEFKTELLKWLKEKDVSRRQLISSLQLYDYVAFYGLDHVTLSRWLSGKTVPSIEKQLKIALCMKVNIVDVISRVTVKSVTNNLLSATDAMCSYLDSSINVLSYNSIENVRCEISSLSYHSYMCLFRDFYQNLSALESLRIALTKLRDEVRYNTILLKNPSHFIVGHWIVIENMSKLNTVDPFSTFSNRELSEGVLLMLGYYINSKHLIDLFVNALCYYIFVLSSKGKKHAYIQIIGSTMLQFAKKVFNAELVKFYSPRTKDDIGVYLVKVDIVKSVINPTILPLVRARLECLSTCKKAQCNKCNLIDFVSN